MIRNRLSEHLFRANMSQRKLADAVGTWQYAVSDVCQGRRIFDVPLLLRVCKVLGCEPRRRHARRDLPGGEVITGAGAGGNESAVWIV